MREWIVRKWNWNNGTDFANWISGEITDKVLAEFWYWYRDLKKKMNEDMKHPQKRTFAEMVNRYL